MKSIIRIVKRNSFGDCPVSRMINCKHLLLPCSGFTTCYSASLFEVIFKDIQSLRISTNRLIKNIYEDFFTDGLLLAITRITFIRIFLFILYLLLIRGYSASTTLTISELSTFVCSIKTGQKIPNPPITIDKRDVLVADSSAQLFVTVAFQFRRLPSGHHQSGKLDAQGGKS